MLLCKRCQSLQYESPSLIFGHVCNRCKEELKADRELLFKWKAEAPQRVFDDFSVPESEKTPPDSIIELVNNKYEIQLRFEYILEAKTFWYLRHVGVGSQGILVDKESLTTKIVGGIYTDLTTELEAFSRGFIWELSDLQILSVYNLEETIDFLKKQNFWHVCPKYLTEQQKVKYYSEEELSVKLKQLPAFFYLQNLKVAAFLFSNVPFEYKVSEETQVDRTRNYL